MFRLFRLDGALRSNPEVESWFHEEPAALRMLAAQWFNRMRACGEDVCVVMHDGCPTACVDHAAFAYVGVYKSHVNIGFFPGTEIDDPASLLEGSGKFMRHVKLEPSKAFDSKALERLIDNAYRVTKRGAEN